MNEQTNRGTLRRLTCSCCGEAAGRWHQHWNMDTGFGICVRCVTSKRMRGESEAEILSCYGSEGVSWGMNHEIYGRRVRIVAAFSEHERDRANKWMLAHPTHALLAIHEGLALIADESDRGVDPGAVNEEKHGSAGLNVESTVVRSSKEEQP